MGTRGVAIATEQDQDKEGKVREDFLFTYLTQCDRYGFRETALTIVMVGRRGVPGHPDFMTRS